MWLHTVCGLKLWQSVTGWHVQLHVLCWTLWPYKQMVCSEHQKDRHDCDIFLLVDVTECHRCECKYDVSKLTRFEDLTAVLMKIKIFLDVIPCGLLVSDTLEEHAATIFSIKPSKNSGCSSWHSITSQTTCMFIARLVRVFEHLISLQCFWLYGFSFQSSVCHVFLTSVFLAYAATTTFSACVWSWMQPKICVT